MERNLIDLCVLCWLCESMNAATSSIYEILTIYDIEQVIRSHSNLMDREVLDLFLHKWFEIWLYHLHYDDISFFYRSSSLMILFNTPDFLSNLCIGERSG